MAGLVAARCVLGVLEAGFGAGAPYYLSLFYQRKELGLRVALLTGMSPLANCFAASLAYGITHIKGSLEPWRLLFLIGNSRLLLVSIVTLTALRGCSDYCVCPGCLLSSSRFPKYR